MKINPTLDDENQPENQCSPCIDTANCNENSNFFAYDFIDEGGIYVPNGDAVTDDASVTTSLFFKAGNCGTLFGADGLTSTSIGKSAEVIETAAGDIETAAILLGTGITCEDPSKTFVQEHIINTGDSAAAIE